jgi:ribosomal protein S5
MTMVAPGGRRADHAVLVVAGNQKIGIRTLGISDVARASTEAKRRAVEAAYTDIVTDDLPEWNQDAGLLNWLATL